MSFRVMARTVLHLGAELIGSDGIAFYELIKNAFDAGSPRVDIDVVIRIAYDAYASHADFISGQEKDGRAHLAAEAVTERAAAIADDIDPLAPDATALNRDISR